MTPISKVRFEVELILQNGRKDYRDETIISGLSQASVHAGNHGLDLGEQAISKQTRKRTFDIPQSPTKNALLTKFRQMRDNTSGSEQVVDYKLVVKRLKE